MSTTRIPLGVLDLVPVSSGSTAGAAVANALGSGPARRSVRLPPVLVRRASPQPGAIAFPTPQEASRHRWSDEDRTLVADRVNTQIVGSPATAVAGLERLAEATGADELLVTTITHDHADRVRSYQLLAESWAA